MKNTLDLTPILLPTKDERQIGQLELFSTNGILQIYKGGSSIGKPHHIHLCSDREIKEGDWMYLEKGNTPATKQGEISKCFFEGADDKSICTWRKIEFTTDQKLIADGVPALPEIACKRVIYPDGTNGRIKSDVIEVNFLEEFVKRYNGEQKYTQAIKRLEEVWGDDKDGKYEELYNHHKQKGVDVEKLADEIAFKDYTDFSGTFKISNVAPNAYRYGITRGYNLALQSNAGEFSLRDAKTHIVKFMHWMSEKNSGPHENFVVLAEDYIQSITPTTQGEVEMFVEMEHIEAMGYVKSGWIIKLINGQPIIHFK